MKPLLNCFQFPDQVSARASNHRTKPLFGARPFYFWNRLNYRRGSLWDGVHTCVLPDLRIRSAPNHQPSTGRAKRTGRLSGFIPFAPP